MSLDGAREPRAMGIGVLGVLWLATVSAGCGAAEPADTVILPLEGDHVFITAGSALHVFDAATLERVARVEVGEGAGEVHSTPDRRTLWAVASGASQIAIVDAASLETRIVPVGARPVHSYLDPDGARIWVSNDGSGDISIVDIETATELARPLTGNGHHKMAFVTGEGGTLDFVYVSNISDATITVLDPDGERITQIDVGAAPHGIDYSPSTRRVYNCSGDDAHSIEVLDPFAATPHAIVSRIPLPARCGALHVEGDGAHAWASVGSTGQLARIELATETVELFDAGPSPDKWVIVDGRAFVANVTEPTVSVIDLESGARRTIAVGETHLTDGRGHRPFLHRNLLE